MTRYLNYDNTFVYENSNEYKKVVSLKKKMYNRGSIMTELERNELLNWANYLVENSLMDELTHKRLSRRINLNDTVINPLVFEIKKRLEQKEKLESFKHEHYVSDFITVVPTNGYIHKHTDPNDFTQNLFHTRFNIFISVPQIGGNTYYDGHEVDAVEGCYVLSRSGVDLHWSDINKDTIPRISLSFGYLLPAEKVDELCNDTSVGKYTQYYPLVLNFPINVLSLNTILNTFEIEEKGDKGSCIFTATNVISDSQCKFITEYILKHSDKLEYRNVSYGNNVECKYISVSDMVNLNLDNDSKKIDHFIFKIVGIIIEKLKMIYPQFNGTKDNGYVLRQIHGGTKIHIDGVESKAGGYTNFVRCLSLIIVLNDDYDGGIFNFPNQGLKLKVKKGEAIMFPPYWTHPHSVTSVGEGQARYTINTWILEKFID